MSTMIGTILYRIRLYSCDLFDVFARFCSLLNGSWMSEEDIVTLGSLLILFCTWFDLKFLPFVACLYHRVPRRTRCHDSSACTSRGLALFRTFSLRA